MKNSQLQIRLSSKEKHKLARLAEDQGLSVSEYVLERIFQGTSEREKFEARIKALDREGIVSSVTAEINDLLTGITVSNLKHLIERPLYLGKAVLTQAYIAAMLEQACVLKSIKVPDWLAHVPALPEPWFATTIISLRAHLLLNSPPPFRRRNIFIDSSLGMRV